MSRKALIIMAKQPRAGRTKTRMMPHLSADEAAALYTHFLQDTVDLARSLPGVTPVIAYAPDDGPARQFMEGLAPQMALIAQAGRTLGERLDHVLSTLLDDGFEQVAAMNSDSPNLPRPFLQQAFERLGEGQVDVVLGPTADGGYYLIGWERPHPRLVRGVQMSTKRVLQDTLAIAADQGLRVRLLPSWYDVDEFGDLLRLRQDLDGKRGVAEHTRAFLQQSHIRQVLSGDHLEAESR